MRHLLYLGHVVDEHLSLHEGPLFDVVCCLRVQIHQVLKDSCINAHCGQRGLALSILIKFATCLQMGSWIAGCLKVNVGTQVFNDLVITDQCSLGQSEEVNPIRCEKIHPSRKD